MSDIAITDAPDQRRFEARKRGELVGWIDYVATESRLVLTHAETAREHRGHGIGGAVVQAVLDDIRARPEPPQVVPACGFVAHWIGQHPEYADLTAPHEPR